MSDPAAFKIESERYILAQGGTICDWLPVIDSEELSPRETHEVASRALALNVLIHLSFGAPVQMMRDWLEKHALLDALTPDDLRVIKAARDPDQDKKNFLRWYVECALTAAWVGGLLDDLSPVQDIPETLASCFPNLKNGEGPDAFREKFRLRSVDEIHAKLDLFFRSHWHTRNCELSGKDAAPFHPGVVQMRRHMLEWVMHKVVAWEEVELST